MFAGLATVALSFGTARAQTQPQRDTTTRQPGTQQPGTMGQQPTTRPGQQGRMGQQAQQTAMPIAGVVTQRDSAGMLTVVAPLGATTEVVEVGQNAYVVDDRERLMAVEGRLGQGATITKDGKTARVTEIKEGDFVRATWNAQNQTFTKLEATSAKELRKESRKEQKPGTREKEPQY